MLGLTEQSTGKATKKTMRGMVRSLNSFLTARSNLRALWKTVNITVKVGCSNNKELKPLLIRQGLGRKVNSLDLEINLLLAKRFWKHSN